MAGFKLHGCVLMLIALYASETFGATEISGIEKLSYSIVTSQTIVPGNEFLVHLNLFSIVNSTLTKIGTNKPTTGKVEFGDNPSDDHTVNLNITVEGLVSYYHNLKITVGKTPTNFSEVIRFMIPEVPELMKTGLISRTDYLGPIFSRIVTIRATNTLSLEHSARLPVVLRKVHPMIITDKLSYLKGDKVKLAVLCHYSDMKPYKGSMNISLISPEGIEQMGFRFDRSPNGIIVRDISIEQIYTTGLYNISLSVMGETVNKTILISEEVKKNFDVKVVVPSHISVHVTDMSKSSDIKCTIQAFYPSGMPVMGLVEPKIMIRNSTFPSIWIMLEPIALTDGIAFLTLPITEVQSKTKMPTNSKLANTVLDIQFIVFEKREEWHMESPLSQHEHSGLSALHPTSNIMPTSEETTPKYASASTLESSSTPLSSKSTPIPSVTRSPTSGHSSMGSITPLMPSETNVSGTSKSLKSGQAYLVDSSRVVVVNTTVVFTDEPLTLEFSDFTPSTFRREQKFIGYINMRPLDEVSQSLQYMHLNKVELLKLEKGEQLNHLAQLIKVFPMCPLTIDYLERREVELKIRHFSTMPKTLPHLSTEKPIKEEILKLSVLPSIVSSFEFMGLKSSSKVEIEATYKDKDTGKTIKIVKSDIIAFQTHSKKFQTVQIRLNQERPNITLGETLKTTISGNFPIKRIFYEIYNDQLLVASGNKTWLSVSRTKNLEVLFNTSESRLLPPVARLLIWTTTPEKEIVADSLTFIVETSPLNRTRIEVSKKELTNNRNLTSILYARPNTDVLILSSHTPLLMGTKNPKMPGGQTLDSMLRTISKERVNTLAKKLKYTLLHSDHSRTPLMNSLSLPSLYSSSSLRPFQYLPGSSCMYSALLSPGTLKLNNYTSLPSLYHDSFRVFNESRSMIFTDGIVQKSTLEPITMKVSSTVMRLTTSPKNLLKDRSVTEQLEMYVRNLGKLPMQDTTVSQLDYFRLIRVGESGVVNFTMELAAERALYTIQALSIHSEHGVEVLEEPIQVAVRPPVLATLRNPLVVVEGEEFALKVKLHNSEPKPIEVEVMIQEQDEFKVVCKKDIKSPTSRREFKTHTLKIGPGEIIEHTFYIETIMNPRRSEMSTIEVPVIIMHEKVPQVSITTFKILPLGKITKVIKGRMVELSPSKQEFEIATSLPMPLISAPRENIFKTVKLYRDVMAPVIERMCQNLFNMTTTDEIEMMNFKIALFGVSHVLSSIKIDSEVLGNKWEHILNRLNKSIDVETSVELQKINQQRIICLKNVVERYQSIFKGSVKITKDTPESIMMSLTVLESMVEWLNVADVNITDPTRTITLLLKQQKPSGEFLEDPKTPVLYNEMAPNSLTMNVPLTSKAIIVLTKCKERLPLTSSLIEKINTSIMKACKYIETKIVTKELAMDSLSINMATYAMTLCNSPKLFLVMARRNSLKMEKLDETFWLQINSPSTPTTKPSTPSTILEEIRHKSVSVLSTSYAALTYLRTGDLNTSRTICNWLLSQMKENGQFINSEDTGVALEALSIYSRLLNQRNRVGLSHVLLSIRMPGNSNKTFTFNTTQSIIDISSLMKQMSMPEGVIKISLEGRGLVILHEIVNAKEMTPKNKEVSESVQLKVTATKKSDLMDLVKICVKLTKPSPGEFVMIEVPILSGHVFNKERNLETLTKLGLLLQPIVNGTLQLITNKVTDSKDTCFELVMEISQRVGNIQPRIITASTYAESGSPSMVSYSESHHKHEVASICPSCQCTTSLTPKGRRPYNHYYPDGYNYYVYPRDGKYEYFYYSPRSYYYYH